MFSILTSLFFKDPDNNINNDTDNNHGSDREKEFEIGFLNTNISR